MIIYIVGLNNLKRNSMIKTEVYKHDGNYDLEKHIKSKIRQGYKLLSCSTKDIFWTFSLYNKKSTLVWEK